MIEPEQIKGITLLVAGGVTKLLAMAASSGAPDEHVSMWIERSGTGLAVGLLIYAVRVLRAERDDRQKRLDAMHDKEVETASKSTEARMQLATALDKLSEKLDAKK